MENSDDYLLQKKVEIMIDTHSKKVKSEFDNLKNELESIRIILNRLTNDINDLKKNINDNNGSHVKEQTIIQNNESEKPKPKMHPRCGDYTSEDVSVNKFFYFGNKR